MPKTFLRIRQFLVSEDGPTAVEYAVMLTFIFLAIVAIVTQLGLTVSRSFSSVNSTFVSS
jgi:pilus assembly protein Flp/PilA